jgi:hypothetical protein
MDTESNSRPLFLLAGVLIVMVGLLVVSKATNDDGAKALPGQGGPGASGPAGNYQPLPFLPNAPLTQFEGGSPINDAPSVTAVQDVREMVHRLPLDRNTPQGWSNPAVKKPPTSR